MYPRNAASPERIAIGPVILISDGTPQSSGVTVTVRGQGGAEAGSAGTIAFGATGVIVYYTPTQAETDFTSFTVIASKASCIPACVTIITSASATPGYAGVDWGKVTNPTTTLGLSNTTVGVLTTYTGNTVQTGDSFARIGVAGAGLTNIDLPNQTMDITGSLSGSVGSVTGAVGSVTGLTAATVHSDLDDIQARLPAALVGGRIDASVGAMAANVVTAAAVADGALDAPTFTATIVTGTCDALSTTTSVIASAVVPTSTVNDQFKGRIMIFDRATTTAALRGQATDISAYTVATLTFTVTALTTAPVSGDTFHIL